MTLIDRIANEFYKMRIAYYVKYKGDSWFNNRQADREWGDIGLYVGCNHQRPFSMQESCNSYWTNAIESGGSAYLLAINRPMEFDAKLVPSHLHPRVKEWPVRRKYATGQIDSHDFHRQQYGEWEIKCKMFPNKAVRQAFWMWRGDEHANPDDRDPDRYREVDCFEVDGLGKHKIGILWNSDGERKKLITRDIPSLRFGKWQTFKFVWRESYMKFYVDGILVYQMTDKRILKLFNEEGIEMWTLANMYVLWDNPDETALAGMRIRYIKITK